MENESLYGSDDCHGTCAAWYNIACSNILTAVDGDYGTVLTWRSEVNQNAYYFVEVVAESGPAQIVFSASQAGNLGSPVIVAHAGETNAVPLLVGVEYSVTSTAPCTSECTCGGSCTATGSYGYEGLSFPVTGGECRCEFNDPERPAMPQSEGPCVSVAFSDSAVIFEDSYQESSGVWKHKRSTRTWLTVYANGGPDGGLLSVSLQNLEKISPVACGPVVLPATLNLAANETYSAQYLFEAGTPSGATNDISVTASLLPSGQSEAIESNASLTSVKVELESVYTAPENHCANRHTYGVGEKVTFRTVPQSDAITASAHSYNASEEHIVQYNSFGGSLSADMSADQVYTCPVAASFSPKVTVSCGDAGYVPLMKLVNPDEVVTREASWPGGCWPIGLVGEATLRTVNYIGPMHVSFQGIAVSEVPCHDVIPATGCFTQGVHNLSHTADANAGTAYRIKPGNYWCIDSAESTAPETNWVQGVASEMIWKIPIGWHRVAAWAIYLNDWSITGPDVTEYGNTNSVPLLIGGRNDMYLQERHIDVNGVFRTDKFGHWISRSRWCHIVLDGSTVQWFH